MSPDIILKWAPVSWFRLENDDGEQDAKRYQFVFEQMQKFFPGNYELMESYDSKSMAIKYRLKFESEKEETWFRLKYG